MNYIRAALHVRRNLFASVESLVLVRQSRRFNQKRRLAYAGLLKQFATVHRICSFAIALLSLVDSSAAGEPWISTLCLWPLAVRESTHW
jgi:hypothetical protein